MLGLLENPRAFTAPLLILLFDRLGSDMLEYEPETLRTYITEINPKTLESSINKINAGIALLTTNAFWKDPATFANICRTLNRHRSPAADAPDVDDIAWGVHEAALIYPGSTEYPNETEYSPAIQKYIAYMLELEGVVDPPESLAFVPMRQSEYTMDDPDMLLSIQRQSDDSNAEIDQQVYVKTLEWLNQIKSLQLPDMSAEAKQQLTEIIQAYEQRA